MTLIQELLEFTSLSQFQVMSFALNLVTSCVGEILIGLLHFLFEFLDLHLNVHLPFLSIGFDKILLHEGLDLILLLTIFAELILDESRKLLLLTDLYFSVKAVKTPFSRYLLHMQIEDLSITEFMITQKDSLSKLVHHLRCIN